MTAGLQISVKFARLILHELTVQAESIIFLYLYYMQIHWYWSHILVYEANLMKKQHFRSLQIKLQELKKRVISLCLQFHLQYDQSHSRLSNTGKLVMCPFGLPSPFALFPQPNVPRFFALNLHHCLSWGKKGSSDLNRKIL